MRSSRARWNHGGPTTDEPPSTLRQKLHCRAVPRRHSHSCDLPVSNERWPVRLRPLVLRPHRGSVGQRHLARLRGSVAPLGGDTIHSEWRSRISTSSCLLLTDDHPRSRTDTDVVLYRYRSLANAANRPVLLIVTEAGASHDSIAHPTDSNFQPPLTSELFAQAQYLRKYLTGRGTNGAISRSLDCIARVDQFSVMKHPGSAP
jgi:hypothetical protein